MDQAGNQMINKKRVVVIGQGYVGLNLAVYSAKNYLTYGFDISSKIVSNLKAGQSHIEDIADSEIQIALKENRYIPTNNEADIEGADIYVIAVPTPLDDARQPDLSYVASAAELIARVASKTSLVINESTSYPGTLREFIKPLIEANSNVPHLFAASPERVDPGRTDFTQENTPRLVGAVDDESLDAVYEFYSSFCNVVHKVSSPEIAEAAKIFENTFRQVNIALVNEFAQIAHALGIPVRETLDAANTKPYGFMRFNPGAGVGGHCIPVDPSYLSYAAERAGISARFIDLANRVNLDMGRYVIDRVMADNSGSIKDKKVQIIGVAYKSNIADVRETPAKLVFDELIKQGAQVTWHDPLVETWQGTRSSDLGSEIAIVITVHDLMDLEAVFSSAPYVFDTTGKVKNAVQL